jgi:hypothetical protein
MLYSRFHLLQRQSWLRSQHDDVHTHQAYDTIWEIVQREYKTECPKRGDWLKRLDQSGAIARMWESAMTDVDGILSGIPGWEPMMHMGEDGNLL